MKRNMKLYAVMGALLVTGICGATAAFAHPTATVKADGDAGAASDGLIAPSISDLAQTVISQKPESRLGVKEGSSTEALVEMTALARVVETGTVSDEDYEANHAIYERCLTAAGYAPEFRQSSDGFYVQLPFHNILDSDALDAALTKCATNTAAIDMIYRLQVANPQLLRDSRVVAVRCLIDNGYVKAGYSPERFEKDWLSDTFPFDAAQAGPNDCLWGAGYGYFVEGE